MKLAEKKNRELDVYEICYIPDGAVLSQSNMDELVVCAQCGRPLRYGDSYCSMEIFSGGGFGYAVCDSCHQEEKYRRWPDMKKTEQLTPGREIEKIVKERSDK